MKHGGREASPLLLLCSFVVVFLSSSSCRASLSELSVVPKPRHLSLLKSAVEREILNEESSDIWDPLTDQGWKPCIRSTDSPLPETSEGYLQVFLDGGLNQQRMGICDAVAVAKMLNATLVIPHFEVNPVWKDSSSFMDIFDVDHFINVLKDDVAVVRELPDEYFWSTREYYAAAIRDTRIKTAPVHASANWYLDNVLPYLRQTSDVIVKQKPSKFVVLHLRFDKDMAAHSACDFGGGKAEKLALAKYRQAIWQGRVLNSQFTDEELRYQGRCPLTPEEIGLVLAALGFDNTTRLYLASHKVYGGEARISTLRTLFPLMEDKKSLASSEERARIKQKASLLAAVDYYVGLQSDIFISASPGNMHNALVGHRTYNNAKTIRPRMALLGQLFLNKNITWAEFRQEVVEGHGSRQGQMRLRKAKQSIYTYPAPDCMCHV
ncbi:O-fucosyltransferase 31 [Linum perenne]